MNIGKCNKCGHEVPTDSPQVGYFCGQIVSEEYPGLKHDEKPIIVKRICRGVVIRTRKEENEVNPS